MQERRPSQKPLAKTPSGDVVKVPTQHWEDLEKRNVESLCENSLATDYPPKGLLLPFLKENLLVDTHNRCLLRLSHGRWVPIDHYLLELLCLVYLLNVGHEPLTQEMITSQELKSAHFFRGSHELTVQPLLQRYGGDLEGFKEAAERLGGEALDLADAAYKLSAFPKAPVYYLFWKGDEEFEPRLSILFDRSIECHLSADAIWGLVNLVSDMLLMRPRNPDATG
jgi:hypothetical protein